MDEINDGIIKLKDDISYYKHNGNHHYLNKFFIEKGSYASHRLASINEDVNKISQDGKLNIWMKCFLKDNRLYFEIAAESYIGNGISHSMEQIFSNCTTKQIIDFNVFRFYDIFEDTVFLSGQKPIIDIIMNKIVDYAILYGRNAT